MTTRTLLATVLFWAAITPASPASPAGLERGFLMDDDFQVGSREERDEAYRHARVANTRFLKVPISWNAVAPGGKTKPSGFEAQDPGDPLYRWSQFDRTLAETVAQGFEPVVQITFAPAWAEGPGRPRDGAFTRQGTWRPDPRQLGLFAYAAARRYRGDYPDPEERGSTLPAVKYWQVWNEPNLWPFLRPQWTVLDGSWKPFAPRHYARMLTSAFAGIKAAQAGSQVVMAGLGPFGQQVPARDGRIPPLRFVREMFCLTPGDLRAKSCSLHPRLDVYAHHPYSRGGPTQPARNVDDATMAELDLLARTFRAAERAGTSRPHGRKPFWVTEMGWDSNPPDPSAVPAGRQAKWLNESFYVMWKAGVSLAMNLQMRDQPIRKPRPGQLTRQSGIFYRGRTIFHDRPKPALRAFAFPFVVDRNGTGRGLAWGVGPCDCDVTVETKRNQGWRPVASLSARRNRVFMITVSLKARERFRARAPAGGFTSLQVDAAGL